MTRSLEALPLITRTESYIDGAWVGSDRRFPVTCPATDRVLAEVPNLGAAETRDAVAAAARAWPSWRGRTAAARGAILRRWFDLMLEHAEALAQLVTAEMGKPLREARGEVAYAASFLEWAAEEGKRIYGETLPASTSDKRLFVLRQSLGVAAIITPWNFPLGMLTRKVGPALAAGCTVVVKPAEKSPLSALAWAALGEAAGVPPGVLNVVTGDPEPVGDVLLSDPRVRALSFTGSTAVGRKLFAKAAQNITRLSLELGGHAPLIVFDDADLERAIDGAVASKFRNAGQTCICANRLFVHDTVYDRFMAGFRARVAALRVGPGFDPESDVGPLIDDAAVAKVLAQVEDARRLGAKVSVGGELRPVPGCAPRFMAPTILEEATPEMCVMREETFGPVAPVVRFSREEEVILAANALPYGLAAYVYAGAMARVVRVVEALEYGIVGVNDALPSVAQAPFGGMKASGIGREGGKYGMDEYLELKFVSLGL